MKILFIGNNAVLPDYLHDSVFHGLRELYGETVVDANKLWYLYKDADLFNQQNFENIRKPLHGWGYTYGGNLNNLNIDRTDIVQKIKNQYFDLLIFGICRGDPRNFEKAIYERDDLLNKALEIYPPKKLIFLDGSDSKEIKRPDLLNRGIYFKRENTGIGIPISFAIPKEKINFSHQKKKLIAEKNIPAHNRKNYKHATEASYYSEYGESYFAITCKKGGYDCIRHYEIMSQGCLPLFADCESMSKYTMSNSNIDFFMKCKSLIQFDFNIWTDGILKIHNDKFDINIYESLRSEMYKNINRYTTESLCKYLIKKINEQ